MSPPDATRKEPARGEVTPAPEVKDRSSGANNPSTQQQTPQAGPTPTPGARRAHTVHVKDLNAYYGSFHALKHINLEFPPNEVTGLIGPSGCGKSTLVRCINRMHEEIPSARAEGTVLLDDDDIYSSHVDITIVRRQIGMVFQKANPFPTMSISGNVASGLKLSGVRGERVRERVERSLKAVGLWPEVSHRLNAPGVGLSGGQQQRLCIARTIAVEPEVILMDEPASALDPIATLKVEELIEELKARYTIVLVTHNMQQAARVADSTVFMLNGEVIEHAPTDKLFTKPSDERTERYVTGKFG